MSSKITDLTEQTAGTLHDDDLFVDVDVSDTTMAPSGTDKKSKWSSIKSTLKTYFDTLYPTPAAVLALNQVSRLAGDFTATSTSLVDVTGMSATLEANATYSIKLIGGHTTNTTTEGTMFSINGSTAAANVVFSTLNYTGLNTFHACFSGHAYDAALATTLAGPGATERPVMFEGVVTNGGSSSTLFLRMATETGGANSSVLKAGAVMIVTKIG